MSIEIKIPDLGDGIESGDILEVLVSEGDQIAVEQGVVELETDKATVEVPSSHAGTVTKVHVKAGETVKVGAVLITVEAAAAAATPAAPPAEPQPAAPTPAPAAAPAPPAAPPAAPPTAVPPAVAPTPPAAATPIPVAPTPAAVAPPAPPAVTSGAEPAPAGPAVRRFARELGVDLQRVTGTGPGGRISREDVMNAVRSSQAVAAAPPLAAQQPVAAPPVAATGDVSNDAWGPIRVERMSKIRKTIAAQMHRSWSECPRVTNFDDADITELEHIRQSSKDDYSAQGIKLTSMTFVIKAVAMSLKRHPLLNASIDMENGNVIYKDYVNIGIAVDTDRGLVVPSLRGADRLSIPEIARQLAGIARSARTNSFALEDLRGGTFTISNLGAVGGAYSTPIINVPEVAILLLGRGRKQAIVTELDEIAVRLMLPLSLSYDHRLVDGAAAGRFLNEVIAFLQAPNRLLLAP